MHVLVVSDLHMQRKSGVLPNLNVNLACLTGCHHGDIPTKKSYRYCDGALGRPRDVLQEIWPPGGTGSKSTPSLDHMSLPLLFLTLHSVTFQLFLSLHLCLHLASMAVATCARLHLPFKCAKQNTQKHRRSLPGMIDHIMDTK